MIDSLFEMLIDIYRTIQAKGLMDPPHYFGEILNVELMYVIKKAGLTSLFISGHTCFDI